MSAPDPKITRPFPHCPRPLKEPLTARPVKPVPALRAGFVSLNLYRAMQIIRHKVVGLSYRLRDESGQLVESRDAMNPLYYLHGEGLLLTGVEDALEGSQKGDRFEVTIQPADAYGERDTDLVTQVPPDALGIEGDPSQFVEPGTPIRGSIEQVGTVVKVAPDAITVDANHPLAGKTLTVEGEVIDVRDAMAEEVALGRASAQDDSTVLIRITMREQKDTE